MQRLRLILGVALIAVIGAGAILAFLLIVRATRAQSRETGAEGGGRPTAPVAVLLQSAATTAYFAAVPGATTGAYAGKVEAWRAWLVRAGYRVVSADPDRLGAEPAKGGDEAADADRVLAEWPPGAPPVIVAPSCAALADDALASVLAAVERGAGIVATREFAVRNAAGEWRGYEPLQRLVGVRAVEAASPLHFVALHGNSPLAAGLPAGARLEFQAYDAPLTVTTDEPAGSWVRWELLPLSPDGSAPDLAAIVAGRHGRGRAVWFDFEPNALVAGTRGRAWIEQLTVNALAWARQRPMAAIERWPRGARLAVLLGLDAEHRFGEAAGAAERCRDAGLPLTSFAVSSLAAGDPATVGVLAAAGEVASHTHDHVPLAGLDLERQRAELERSRTILSELSHRPVTGLRPPEESTDAATLTALAETGYDYIAGLADKDRAEPWIVESAGRSLVVLPRVPRDDYEFVVRDPVVDGAAATAAIRRDLQHLRRLGGLYYFSFHSQYVADPRIAAALEELEALARMSDAWLATGSAISSWWRARAGASVAVDDDPSGIRIEVDAQAAAERLGVVVYLADQVGAARIEPELGAAPVSLDLTQRPLRLEYRDVRAGERRVTRLVRG